MILEKNSPETFSILKENFYKGKIAVLPTDTIYGFSSLYKIGREPLEKIKNRDSNKPFIVLSDIKHLKNICPEVPEILVNTWPAPLTAVLKTDNKATIAVRVPDDIFLLNLIQYLDSPVYSTSVNISGEPFLTDFNSIYQKFKNKIDIFIRDKNMKKNNIASTLIDATLKPFRLLRQGSFNAAKIIEISQLS